MNERFERSLNLKTSSIGSVPALCDFHGCLRPPILRLDSRLLCLEHLVTHCLQRLEACQEFCRNFASTANTVDTAERNNRFLEECTTKVAVFLMAGPELQNIDRARLLDLLLWAAELDSKYKSPVAHCRAAVKAAGTP